jgi:hypothetical protein
MTDFSFPNNVEVIPVNFALAYSALARRVAAADAYLYNSDSLNARAQIEAAMQEIEKVEKFSLIVVPGKGGSNG